MELLQWGKNIFCIHQGVVGILIVTTATNCLALCVRHPSKHFTFVILLLFSLCSNPTSWVLLLSPFTNKEMDMSEPEQGPCLPVPSGITSPQQCLARGRHSVKVCSLYEWGMSGWATSCTTPFTLCSICGPCEWVPLGSRLTQLQEELSTLCSVYRQCEWVPLCHGSPADRGQNQLANRDLLCAKYCHPHFSEAPRRKVAKPRVKTQGG